MTDKEKTIQKLKADCYDRLLMLQRIKAEIDQIEKELARLHNEDS